MTSPVLMGILNITPDSFSDGGQWVSRKETPNLKKILAHAHWLIDNGCSVLDVGGESTRPGAVTVPVDEELARVVPVIAALKQEFPNILLSVDTRKACVAHSAIETGATIVNDVSGLTYDPDMVKVIANSQAKVVLMHSQGTPDVMQDAPAYQHVAFEVKDFLQRQTQWAVEQGIPLDHIVWDVGFGFGKSVTHNLQLLASLQLFTHSGIPVMLGTSRKSFLALGQAAPPPAERDMLTAATVWHGMLAGCSWFRVHNPQAIQPVLQLGLAMQQAMQQARDDFRTTTTPSVISAAPKQSI